MAVHTPKVEEVLWVEDALSCLVPLANSTTLNKIMDQAIGMKIV